MSEKPNFFKGLETAKARIERYNRIDLSKQLGTVASPTELQPRKFN